MTTPVQADPAAALCAFLRARVGTLLALTPGTFDPPRVPAVFRPDLPQGFDTMMPTSCIVVRPAGGYKQFGDSQLYLGDPLMDIVCYGDRQQRATSICQAVVVQLKQLVVQEWENVLLYAAHVSGGPTPLPDTQTLWPACWMSTQLIHGELPLH